MQKKDYDVARSLFIGDGEQYYPETLLDKFRNRMNSSKAKGAKSYSRLVENAVWYDVVTLSLSNNPDSYSELFIQEADGKAKIAMLVFR